MPAKASKRVPLSRKYVIQKKVRRCFFLFLSCSVSPSARQRSRERAQPAPSLPPRCPPPATAASSASPQAREHERKARRAAKANPALRKKLSKGVGIPNLNPFKNQILARLEAQERTVALNDKARQKRQQDFALKRRAAGEDPLAGLAADAAARERAFAALAAAAADGGGGGAAAAAAAGGAAPASAAGRAGELTRRAFYRHVRSLLERSDILLEVLDARDPLACRAPAIEALALAADPPKRVVLVLNKIDLVPPAAVTAWLAYLRRDFPTVAFKASTQQQRAHLSAPGGAAVNAATEAGTVLTGAGAAGADTLLQLIKNYSRSHDLKTAVTVGVVGYPNVGKSSLINSLKRGRAVGVSSTPGHTRALQEVSLDAKVSLIDCPGVIFDDDGAAAGGAGAAPGDDAGAGLLLRNCVRVEDVADPEGAVAAILRRCNPAKLMALYALPAFASAAEFLALVAAKRGKLGKGGVPDKAAAARAVLADWNSGKIPFYVLPPAPAPGTGAGSAGGADADADADAGAGARARAGAGAGAAPRRGAVAVAAGEDDGIDASAAIVAGWSKVSAPARTRPAPPSRAAPPTRISQRAARRPMPACVDCV